MSATAVAPAAMIAGDLPSPPLHAFSYSPEDSSFLSWEAEALTRALEHSIAPSPSRPAALPPPPPPPTGRIAKRRRARASRRSPTTFITADPAHFREMVQKVTGAGFEAPDLARPERPRSGSRAVAVLDGFLPTLDTSAVLLDREEAAAAAAAARGEAGFGCFPTLESWGLV